jgi:glutathione S-transferase
MPVTVFGFPRSTYVKVVRLILTEKGVDYHFHDTEPEMYLPVHLERHPFGRVPVLHMTISCFTRPARLRPTWTRCSTAPR